MDSIYETDKWPFVQARFFQATNSGREVRVIVIHSMESEETNETAEINAKRFQTTTKEKSAHVCVDNNSIVQCVLDKDVAWAAPGANRDGIQIELAGYAKQNEAEWLDPYSTLVIENAANVAAQYCLKYSLPIRRLSNGQLEDGQSKGIVSHSQVSEVFKKSTHTDPGAGFPWPYFLGRVRIYYDKRQKKLNDG